MERYTDLQLFDLKGTVERLPLPLAPESRSARSAS